MTEPITELDDPRLVKALAHPLRMRIMTVLEQRSATPKHLAAELEVPLENLSYHVRALRDVGLIELEDQRIVRGAVEHRYRASARPRISTEAWNRLPNVVREALVAADLGQIGQLVSQAAAQGTASGAGSQLSRRLARLDERGLAEAAELMGETLDRLALIEREAGKRLDADGADGVPMMLIAMLFRAPELDGAASERAP
jgi:DNA-binding transcriptional ArsR family regulator